MDGAFLNHAWQKFIFSFQSFTINVLSCNGFNVSLSVKWNFKKVHLREESVWMCIFSGYFLTHIFQRWYMTFIFPWFPFRAMGHDYLEQSDTAWCKISCHVAWIRTAISRLLRLSNKVKMCLQMSRACIQIREEREWKNVQRVLCGDRH